MTSEWSDLKVNWHHIKVCLTLQAYLNHICQPTHCHVNSVRVAGKVLLLSPGLTPYSVIHAIHYYSVYSTIIIAFACWTNAALPCLKSESPSNFRFQTPPFFMSTTKCIIYLNSWLTRICFLYILNGLAFMHSLLWNSSAVTQECQSNAAIGATAIVYKMATEN